jgi:tetratricopeptide (TPR) repeat protein
MREKTEGADNAIHFVRSSLTDFPEQHNQSTIWERVAELHMNQGDKISSFIAAEIALEMQPLNKNLRFQLGYRYADDQATKPLAYYHYNKLQKQDYRHPHCLNNLAILFDELGMTATYVTTLKNAKGFDQPYPHGNLAVALAKAGFLDEAKATIEELPQHLRLETRAAEAAEFIRQKRSDEAKKMEQLERTSDLFHKVYLAAALGVERGESLDSADVMGVWKSKPWELSLQNEPSSNDVVGTLRSGETEYRARLRLASNILSGEATPKSASVGFFSFSVAQKMLLAPKGRGKITGIIYSDEINPSEVTLVRQD